MALKISAKQNVPQDANSVKGKKAFQMNVFLFVSITNPELKVLSNGECGSLLDYGDVSKKIFGVKKWKFNIILIGCSAHHAGTGKKSSSARHVPHLTRCWI